MREKKRKRDEEGNYRRSSSYWMIAREGGSISM